MKRGTFSRWRKRLTNSGNDQGFIDVPAIKVPWFPLGGNQGLEVHIDLEQAGAFIHPGATKMRTRINGLAAIAESSGEHRDTVAPCRGARP